MSNIIELKAHKLVADLIDSALSKGWELSEDEEEEKLLEKEIRNIEKDLRKLTQLTENQYELYLESKEIKRRQKEMTDSSKFKCLVYTNEQKKLIDEVVEKYMAKVL